MTHLGSPRIPQFEGAPVESVEMRISGLSKVDAEEAPVFTVDDRVRLVGEFKCVGVRHETNKNGDLIRVQMLSPITVDTTPWDPSDPDDDGVIRAR